MTEIRRTFIAFEDQYTQVPNAWVRDKRLTRKARGLLVELLSHRIGWRVTTAQLIRDGREGRDAVMTAIQELEDHGYLQRGQERTEAGTFAAAWWTLTDPDETDSESTGNGLTANGLSVNGKPAHKEEHIPKKNKNKKLRVHDFDEDFETWWALYPRKVAKGSARVAYRAARKKLGEDGARVLTQTVSMFIGSLRAAGTEMRHIPHASTWLNGERWLDDIPKNVDGAPAQPRKVRRFNDED